MSVTSNRGSASERPGVFTTGRENGRRRPRGYAEWNPHAPTRALIDTVAEILDDYDEHLPLTVRQIFYRLVASYSYEKDEKAYKRLGEHLVRARRAGMVPFGAIRDDGVVTYSETWYGGPDDFWDDTACRMRAYRRDRQAGQRLRLELWCEAAGMAPQLARVADRYSVPVYSATTARRSCWGTTDGRFARTHRSRERITGLDGKYRASRRYSPAPAGPSQPGACPFVAMGPRTVRDIGRQLRAEERGEARRERVRVLRGWRFVERLPKRS